MLFMESGEKRGMFSSIKGTKMWKRNKKIALYVCWPQWGKFHLLYICKNIPQLVLLKNKKNVLPFDSMDYARVRCKMTTKRGKHNFFVAHFSYKTTESKETALVLSWQIYDHDYTLNGCIFCKPFPFKNLDRNMLIMLFKIEKVLRKFLHVMKLWFYSVFWDFEFILIQFILLSHDINR